MQAPGITRARRPFLAPLWVGASVLLVSTVLLFAVFRMGARWLGETTTVIVLRHAEKSALATDPPLSVAGRERAARLDGLLRESGLRALYVSDTQRARETAEPLARRLGVAAIEYPGRETNDLVKAILARHRGETVLVVGHSNTVPRLLERLSDGRYSTRLAEDEFDGLYIVTIPRFDPPAVLQLRY